MTYEKTAEASGHPRRINLGAPVERALCIGDARYVCKQKIRLETKSFADGV
jgi:hypothetical protein